MLTSVQGITWLVWCIPDIARGSVGHGPLVLRNSMYVAKRFLGIAIGKPGLEKVILTLLSWTMLFIPVLKEKLIEKEEKPGMHHG